ncbi:dnaJ homolog subfamily C member 28-like [Daphnia pulicaria]|uniref:dnaJ homolog subfamily C member 28-like n=1 Tax=Daphnia pulicaria TaxID=35523 RepID=UPI001EEABD22|nr:dnaJ homolog subfamily C member 28-like [Daphnia pulicaria]
MFIFKFFRNPLWRLGLLNNCTRREISTRFYCDHKIFPVDYQVCYKVLGLNENCSQKELKQAFVELVKKHHPDSSQEVDTAKFQLIENAYRKLQEKFRIDTERSALRAKEDDQDIRNNHQNSEQSCEHDIEHTAPQHRQFLNYEGIGQGTPFQREKQYQKYQVKKAVENVYNHRTSQIPNTEENSLVLKDTKAAKKSKIKHGIDRLVEDLIQESIAKGEFANLRGTGKPLETQNHNPYIDVVTHKINQILIENGFSPQWVMLEKEIRLEITNIKHRLRNERLKLGEIPLSASERLLWSKVLNSLNDDVKQVNKKINDYNLIVPLLNKQMVHINLFKISENCLRDNPSNSTMEHSSIKQEHRRQDHSTGSTDFEPGIFGLLNLVWKNRS